MNTERLKYVLALWRAPGMTPQRFKAVMQSVNDIMQLFGIASQFKFRTMPPWYSRLLSYLKAPDWRGVEQDLQWRHKYCGHILTLKDDSYPSSLACLEDAPPVLFVRGDIALLSDSQIAIVGARKASCRALHWAEHFAQQLARQQWVITSGLALGVDAAAHRGVLGIHGSTVAVMATGLDQVYPRSHFRLADMILERGGAWVSELPCSTPVRRYYFTERNRIISGLSRGVLVIEATLKSGSLVTARLAAEQGREVFALPGDIHRLECEGNLYLIQQGAKLVRNVHDIVEEFV